MIIRTSFILVSLTWASVQSDGKLMVPDMIKTKLAGFPVKMISDDPLIYSMVLPQDKSKIADDRPITPSSHKSPKRKKRQLFSQETAFIQVPDVVREKRCRAMESHQEIRRQIEKADEPLPDQLAAPRNHITPRALSPADSAITAQPATFPPANDDGKENPATVPFAKTLTPLSLQSYPQTPLSPPFKDYDTLKRYLHLIHEQHREAHNALQDKIKEKLSQTKQALDIPSFSSMGPVLERWHLQHGKPSKENQPTLYSQQLEAMSPWKSHPYGTFYPNNLEQDRNAPLEDENIITDAFKGTLPKWNYPYNNPKIYASTEKMQSHDKSTVVESDGSNTDTRIPLSFKEPPQFQSSDVINTVGQQNSYYQKQANPKEDPENKSFSSGHPKFSDTYPKVTHNMPESIDSEVSKVSNFYKLNLQKGEEGTRDVGVSTNNVNEENPKYPHDRSVAMDEIQPSTVPNVLQQTISAQFHGNQGIHSITEDVRAPEYITTGSKHPSIRITPNSAELSSPRAPEYVTTGSKHPSIHITSNGAELSSSQDEKDYRESKDKGVLSNPLIGSNQILDLENLPVQVVQAEIPTKTLDLESEKMFALSPSEIKSAEPTRTSSTEQHVVLHPLLQESARNNTNSELPILYYPLPEQSELGVVRIRPAQTKQIKSHLSEPNYEMEHSVSVPAGYSDGADSDNKEKNNAAITREFIDGGIQKINGSLLAKEATTVPYTSKSSEKEHDKVEKWEKQGVVEPEMTHTNLSTEQPTMTVTIQPLSEDGKANSKTMVGLSSQIWENERNMQHMPLLHEAEGVPHSPRLADGNKETAINSSLGLKKPSTEDTKETQVKEKAQHVEGNEKLAKGNESNPTMNEAPSYRHQTSTVQTPTVPIFEGDDLQSTSSAAHNYNTLSTQKYNKTGGTGFLTAVGLENNTEQYNKTGDTAAKNTANTTQPYSKTIRTEYYGTGDTAEPGEEENHPDLLLSSSKRANENILEVVPSKFSLNITSSKGPKHLPEGNVQILDEDQEPLFSTTESASPPILKLNVSSSFLETDPRKITSEGKRVSDITPVLEEGPSPILFHPKTPVIPKKNGPTEILKNPATQPEYSEEMSSSNASQPNSITQEDKLLKPAPYHNTLENPSQEDPHHVNNNNLTEEVFPSKLNTDLLERQSQPVTHAPAEPIPTNNLEENLNKIAQDAAHEIINLQKLYLENIPENLPTHEYGFFNAPYTNSHENVTGVEPYHVIVEEQTKQRRINEDNVKSVMGFNSKTDKRNDTKENPANYPIRFLKEYVKTVEPSYEVVVETTTNGNRVRTTTEKPQYQILKMEKTLEKAMGSSNNTLEKIPQLSSEGNKCDKGGHFEENPTSTAHHLVSEDRSENLLTTLQPPLNITEASAKENEFEKPTSLSAASPTLVDEALLKGCYDQGQPLAGKPDAKLPQRSDLCRHHIQSNQGKIIIPLDENYPQRRVIIVDPNRWHDSPVQVIELPNRQSVKTIPRRAQPKTTQKQSQPLGVPVYMFRKSGEQDPFYNDDLARSAPDTMSDENKNEQDPEERSESTDRDESNQDQSTSGQESHQKFIWDFLPFLGKPNGKSNNENQRKHLKASPNRKEPKKEQIKPQAIKLPIQHDPKASKKIITNPLHRNYNTRAHEKQKLAQKIAKAREQFYENLMKRKKAYQIIPHHSPQVTDVTTDQDSSQLKPNEVEVPSPQNYTETVHLPETSPTLDPTKIIRYPDRQWEEANEAETRAIQLGSTQVQNGKKQTNEYLFGPSIITTERSDHIQSKITESSSSNKAQPQVTPHSSIPTKFIQTDFSDHTEKRSCSCGKTLSSTMNELEGNDIDTSCNCKHRTTVRSEHVGGTHDTFEAGCGCMKEAKVGIEDVIANIAAQTDSLHREDYHSTASNAQDELTKTEHNDDMDQDVTTNISARRDRVHRENHHTMTSNDSPSFQDSSEIMEEGMEARSQGKGFPDLMAHIAEQRKRLHRGNYQLMAGGDGDSQDFNVTPVHNCGCTKEDKETIREENGTKATVLKDPYIGDKIDFSDYRNSLETNEAITGRQNINSVCNCNSNDENSVNHQRKPIEEDKLKSIQDCDWDHSDETELGVSSSEDPNKYDILHNMLLWLQHYGAKKPA